MQTYKAQLELGLLGNIDSQCARFSQSFSGLAASGRQSLATLGNYAGKTENALGHIFNRGSALLGSAGLGISGKYVSNIQTRLTRLRLQAEVSKEEMEKLNKAIFETAQKRDINIDPGELLSAVEKIVGKTGDIDFATRNLKNFAYAISATGAAGENIGAMGADLMEKFGIKEEKEIISTLGLLVNQGKAGAFELRDLATQGERVTAAYASTGRQGKMAVAEMGAMLQMARKATGGPEQTATALEALIRNLNDPQKRRELQEAGIQVTDPNDPKRLRSIIEISKDLIRVTKGDSSKIGNVIDQEGIRALTAMLIEYNQTGGFKSVDNFLKTSSDPKKLLDDSKEIAQTLDSAMMSLRSAFNYFATSNLAVPVQQLADALNSLSPQELQQYLEYAKTGAVALGSLWLGAKAMRIGAGLLGKTGSVGGTISGLASFTKSTPMPVWVVNNTSGFGGLNKAGIKNIGGGLLANSARALGRLGTAGAIGYGIYETFTAENAREMGQGIGTSIGAAVGSLGGPIGTAIGTVLGRKIGGYVGDRVSDYRKAETNEDKAKVMGKTVGNSVGWMFGGKLGSEVLGHYNEAAAGWIGSLFDNVHNSTEAKAKKEAAQHITQNTIHFTIDRDGTPHLERQEGNLEQTKFDVDVGYTRMYGYEA